jgi:mannose-6-phosphate isomerase
MSQLYPLKFTPILKKMIWGGNKLTTVLNKKNEKNILYGESWEISGVDDNVSKVSNGFLKGNDLAEIIEVYMGDLVGDKIFDKYGLEFPVLIKFIDACDDLSIQVHPNDELAKERHDSMGKTEMWYIIDHEKDAKLITGFNKKIEKTGYIKSLENKSLKDILNSEEVSNGDVFFIPAGRVHAIGKGILLAEIQQTSDITYRIYDWDRVDASGKSRELHTEQALDAIDFDFHTDYKTKYQAKLNQPTLLVKCDYFTTNLLKIDKTLERDYFKLDSFVIYICTNGKCMVGEEDEEKVEISKGETVLIPASLNNVIIIPSEYSEILEVYI